VGSRESVTYANGTKAEYFYDDLNRLTELTNKRIDTDEIISSYSYTLGLAGNRTSVIENDGSEISYTYDNLYRLTEETRTGSDAYSISYIYDEVGNRLSMTKAAETTVYDYNINDQLTTETAPEGITSYEYDNNGNTTRKTAPDGTTDYIFNYNNKLITADVGGEITSYVYGADGNRAAKTDAYGTTNYLVDTNNSTGYAQVLEELDSNNNCMVYYTYGDDLISQARGSLTTYYHYDGHGSTRALTNASAMITDTYTYDAFGNLQASTGDTPNNYKYCGEQYDPNVGFYYLRARYYNPSVGRFLNVDPYAGSAYDPPSLHKYLYAGQDPVNNIDLSGLSSTSLVDILVTVAVQAFLIGTIYGSSLKIIHAHYGVEEVTLLDIFLYGFRFSAIAVTVMALCWKLPFLAVVLPIIGGTQMVREINDAPLSKEEKIAAYTCLVVAFLASATAVIKAHKGAEYKPTLEEIRTEVASPREGNIVLGKYPDYINKAIALRARRFSIPTEIWNKMSKAEQWVANQKFLDRAIALGDNIILSNPVKNLNEVTGVFRQELNYLISKGFRLNSAGTKMIR
ncbi:RHS repeat-associated core domain-containing protein, partial [Candidatus Pacearchaeota archaeon]|nr:RHS repeat-associated core domain-containing protein [Candidatus Pacearchaeota archaeon]